MNYKVLYRKYRPDTFEKVVGQKYIIETLKNSIIKQNISHAYIFSGPRGTGKTSTAKIFAKSINCLNNQNGSPCGECENCKNFKENPDIIEIDAASNNGIDQIRELIDNVKLVPANGKYKVYIIDEVHMLTTSAFNALLLTLEEPPSHVVFILATTNIENVPITILSRCQRYDFKKIEINDIVDALSKICHEEKIVYEQEGLEEIAYLSDGGMRDALSVLDQLSKSNEKITLKFVENEIRTISQNSIMTLLNYIDKNDIKSFLNTIDEMKKRSIDYKIFIKKTIDCLSKQAKNSKILNEKKRLNFEEYKNLIFDLSECINKININVEPYTIIELTFLKYFDLDNRQKTANSDNKTEINIKTEDISKHERLISIRTNNCFAKAKKEFLEEKRNLFNECFKNTSIDGKLKSIISDSDIVAASDEYVILMCQTEHLSQVANNFINQLEKIINEFSNENLKIIFLSSERWNAEKNNYITNLKNNKKYEMINEDIAEDNDNQSISDIFNIEKVEII